MSPRPNKSSPPSKKGKKASSGKKDIRFPIVGMGASAGGLEAFSHFFSNTPDNSGMAFVLVQHLDASHKSMLGELIKKYTGMKVLEAAEGMKVKQDCVYTIPPNRDMAILHGELHLMEPATSRGLRLPIDYFFRSLAEDQKEEAICIILSGTGTDGTLGMKAIKGEGGLCIAQDPESAQYDGMPRSAIGTGLVDYVLPPDEMPEQLIPYVHRSFSKRIRETAEPQFIGAEMLQKIFILLRSRTGHDFSLYKQNTIIRRIERRMTLHQIENPADYLRYAQENPMEVETLFKDLLIGVTHFFRDPGGFEALKEQVIPLLFKDISQDQALRVWVPGCSTGEEAYTIAILLRAYMDDTGLEHPVHVFATDIDADSIESARTGRYPEGIAVDVPPDLLKRYFAKEDSIYRIKKKIRDMLVFAVQDMVKDPPFSRLDLISCRNLLIYMGPELQKRTLSMFHYSLKQGGFLFLGSSETIGEFTDFYYPVDRKSKLFRIKSQKSTLGPTMGFLHHRRPLVWKDATAEKPVKQERTTSFRNITERKLLQSHTPSSVLINEKLDVLYIHGRTGKFLEPESGEAKFNILGMARDGLKVPLTTAIRQAMREKTTIQSKGIKVKTNGEIQVINLSVEPMLKSDFMKGLMLVAFEEVESEPPISSEKQGPGESDSIRVAELEQELVSTREYLKTTIEELESYNEEMQSTNEELQSSNEELQSTNEELDTSREELQSVNEELVTVNAELEGKIQELTEVNNDMINLLSGTHIATIFLDNELHIRRFTPAAREVIKLIPSDIGRPLGDIVTNLENTNLAEDANRVLETLIPEEHEVMSKDGEWFLARAMPYRTTENVIDGAVVVFLNITKVKQTEQAAEEARQFAESIVNTVREPLIVLTSDIRVVTANTSFYKTFHFKPDEIAGRRLYDIGDQQWDIPSLRHLLEEILPGNTTFTDFRVEHDFPGIGHRVMLLNARRLLSAVTATEKILLAIEDITERS